MNFLFKLKLALVCWFISLSSAQAIEIDVAASLTLAPYVIQDTNRGIELDILRAVMELTEIDVKIVYLPFARVPRALDIGMVDAALTINQDSNIENIYYSDSHITYQNVAVCLENSNFNIKAIKDLSERSLVAFQNATSYLGSDYETAVTTSRYYVEVADQTSQLKMLFAHRVDCIILDINIFKYYRNKIPGFDTQQNIDVFPIFPATNFSIGFNNEQYRDEFNAGLKTVKQSGLYQEILDRYIAPH